MTWQQRYHIKHFFRFSFWLVPALCIFLALGACRLTRWLDIRFDLPDFHYSVEGARGLLDGLSGSLLTFLVFVISSMLLIVQIASAQLTPRIIALAFSSRVSQIVLGVFVFTYMYTIATLARIDEQLSPFTVSIAVIGTLASIVVFFWFAQRLGISLRPVSILERVGEETRYVVEAIYPNRFSPNDNARKDWRTAYQGQSSRIIPNQGSSGVLLAFGTAELVAAATQANALIELIPQVGDFLPKDDPLFRVFPADCSLEDSVLMQMIVVGPERTLEQDPVFGFRIMVDIASRALSPAINDPTTAVMAIDQIHRFLRYVGDRQLSDGMAYDEQQRLRFVHPTPNWEDFVSLAVSEIRMFGIGSIQIPRRLRAMLEHLLEVLPEARKAALNEELTLLHQAVQVTYPEGVNRLRAETADRQGLGGVSIPKSKNAA
jgi:uncharacterized membrane protein